MNNCEKNKCSIKCGDIIEIKIEKLTFQGAGLGHILNETNDESCKGLAVFVENACPEDILKVKITKLNKSYATAKIEEIIQPSKHRIDAKCALANVCGGCSWQFVEYNFTCSQKELIIKESLKGIKSNPEILPTIKSPQEWGFRHKVQYPIRETKVSKRILAGYFKEKTHEIVNIKHCPIQPQIVDEIIDFVRSNWVMGAYSEKTAKGLLKHVVIRISSSNEGILLTLVLNCDDLREKRESEIKDFAKKITAAFKEITGILVNFNFGSTNTIIGKKFQLISGNDFIFETLKNGDIKKKYKISADSFFQTNPKCAVQIFETVKNFIKEDSNILDAYGGVGAIGIWVADKVKNVVLVEENEQAVKNAKENFKINGVKNFGKTGEMDKNGVFISEQTGHGGQSPNYEVFLGDAKVQFNNFLIKKRNFDHVILDPPRKGCERGALEIISKITNSIIHVSCNPQTLARDIKILEEAGFICKKIQPIDMFPHTYHIESVALIEKNAVV